MLDPQQLGAFILVLANSLQDEKLHKSLAQPVQIIFPQLLERYQQQKLDASPDDLAVFAALAKQGLSVYKPWLWRMIDTYYGWRCAYNPLRGLRPQRASAELFSSLEHPFDADSFHFAKPFLKPEILSVEHIDAAQRTTELRIMYHKFPFTTYHLLIVIEAEQQRPQFLDRDTHQLAWEMTHHANRSIPGFGVAYNSLGAGASVNHLHLHGFVDARPLAIESPNLQQEKTASGTILVNYPLTAKRFDSADNAWQYISQLHTNKQPYNLLYRPGHCYVVPRKPQGSAPLPDWLSSIGWFEACGGYNLVDVSRFNHLGNIDIIDALSAYRTN